MPSRSQEPSNVSPESATFAGAQIVPPLSGYSARGREFAELFGAALARARARYASSSR
jgi:hypothetical protein